MSFVEIGNRMVNVRYIRAVKVIEVNREAKAPIDRYETSVWIEGEGPIHGLKGAHLEEEISNATRRVIPAQPGWHVIAYEDKGEWVWREPVIGWRVSDFNSLEPVTADWECNRNAEAHHIRRPDGSILKPGDRDWETEEAWLADMRAKRGADQAKPTANGARAKPVRA